MTIKDNANAILLFLAKEHQKNSEKWFSGSELQESLLLNPQELNPSVDILSALGLINRHNFLGTSPFNFGQIQVSSRGLYELERKESLRKAISDLKPINFNKTLRLENFELLMENFIELGNKIKPPIPIGSPYGFTDYDWEIVSSRKNDSNKLVVVFGSKFKSKYYDTKKIRRNVNKLFNQSLDKYNEVIERKITLEYIILKAGYGEHLFNQIARDIISSDIAIFETSDLAPNIFLELGVALTWGSRVFLLKHKNAPRPSSDISGHTYTEYDENGLTLLNNAHINSTYRMVERSLWKKG